MDNGVDFVIERLYRGSIINHRSFLIEDNIDVIAKCATQVSLFYLDFDDIKKLRYQSIVLDTNIHEIEEQLINKDNAIALDYCYSVAPKFLKRDAKVE